MDLSNLTTDDKNIEDEKDVLGGSFGLLDTDAYDCTIEALFISQSDKGAYALNIHAKTDSGNLHREAIYMTNRKGEHTYTKNDKTSYMPGFLTANAICLLSTGTEISALTQEKKVIKLYNSKEKKELPTEVNMLTEALGKRITLGIFKQVVDKTEKGDDDKYHPTGETREENTINKVFRERDHLTKTEIIAEADSPDFYNSWLEKNKGEVINKAKGASGKAGAPTKAASGSGEKKKSLFG